MPFKSRTGTRCVLHIFYDIYIYNWLSGGANRLSRNRVLGDLYVLLVPGVKLMFKEPKKTGTPRPSHGSGIEFSNFCI